MIECEENDFSMPESPRKKLVTNHILKVDTKNNARDSNNYTFNDSSVGIVISPMGSSISHDLDSSHTGSPIKLDSF